MVPCYSLIKHRNQYIFGNLRNMRTREDPIARLLVKIRHLALMFLALVR